MEFGASWKVFKEIHSAQKVQQVNKTFKILSSFQPYFLSILKKYNSINDESKSFIIPAKHLFTVSDNLSTRNLIHMDLTCQH